MQSHSPSPSTPPHMCTRTRILSAPRTSAAAALSHALPNSKADRCERYNYTDMNKRANNQTNGVLSASWSWTNRTVLASINQYSSRARDPGKKTRPDFLSLNWAPFPAFAIQSISKHSSNSSHHALHRHHTSALVPQAHLRGARAPATHTKVPLSRTRATGRSSAAHLPASRIHLPPPSRGGVSLPLPSRVAAAAAAAPESQQR